MKNIIKETYESWCWLCDYLASCRYSHQYLFNKWHIAQWMLLTHWHSETLMHWTCFAKLGNLAKERQGERHGNKASERANLLYQLNEIVAKSLSKWTVRFNSYEYEGTYMTENKYLWLVFYQVSSFFFLLLCYLTVNKVAWTCTLVYSILTVNQDALLQQERHVCYTNAVSEIQASLSPLKKKTP